MAYSFFTFYTIQATTVRISGKVTEENYKGINCNKNAQTTIVRIKSGKIQFCQNGSNEKVDQSKMLGSKNYF